MSDITNSILVAQAIQQNLAAAEREMEGLPANHPARIYFELDKQIVKNNSSVFNEDCEEAVGLIRAQEAAAPPKQSTAEANDAVMDDLDAAVRSSVERESVFGLNRNAVDFEDYRHKIEHSRTTRRDLISRGRRR
jgi:hypothetical protein